MSVDKLLKDLAQVLEEVKASAADKKGDEGQMVALYGMPLLSLVYVRETLTFRNGSNKRWSLCGWESGGNLLGYAVRVRIEAIDFDLIKSAYANTRHSFVIMKF
jgi:hypothetical protein